MWGFLVALDKFINRLFGGPRGQTLSARAGLASYRGSQLGCKLCKLLDRFDKDHCSKEVIKWLKRESHEGSR